MYSRVGSIYCRAGEYFLCPAQWDLCVVGRAVFSLSAGVVSMCCPVECRRFMVPVVVPVVRDAMAWVGSTWVPRSNGCRGPISHRHRRTFDDRRLIVDLVRRYDALRAEAVPFSQSLRLI
jgi:hypothetical protein